MGIPIEGAQKALKDLHKNHTIIIHTVWADSEQKKRAILNWLIYFDIPFDEITSMKPDADYYIDDKAIHFDNWKHVLTLI